MILCPLCSGKSFKNLKQFLFNDFYSHGKKIQLFFKDFNIWIKESPKREIGDEAKFTLLSIAVCLMLTCWTFGLDYSFKVYMKFLSCILNFFVWLDKLTLSELTHTIAYIIHILAISNFSFFNMKNQLELQKNDMVTNFLNLDNRSFENASLSPQ